MSTTKNNCSLGYPEVITRLPKAQIPFEGTKAWILQSENQQLIFFEFEGGMGVPPHSHTYPQWGIVIDGKMELVVDGDPRLCEKGTEYLIPAGTMHSARFFARTRLIDFFSEKYRYKTKSSVPGK